MLSHYYVAEVLHNLQEQEWNRRVRRGDFVQDHSTKVSWGKSLFCFNKQTPNHPSNSVDKIHKINN
ncbi:MAG: hypothetical protein ACE3L7_06935 [Candidatus Pristimantibacillus sp.]